MNRRHFLRQVGAIGAGAALAQLGMFSASAQAAAGDYKALVCVFLFGGNDGNNTVVPLDATGYANYYNVRGTQLGLLQSDLKPLNEAGSVLRYGLHPALTDLQTLWDAGQMAVLLNTGTLVQPLTHDQYLSPAFAKPLGLFSHLDQQRQWQASVSTAPSATGWGGRLADAVAGLNAGSSVPSMISTGGNSLLLTGAATHAVNIPVSGTSFGLSGLDGTTLGVTRANALRQLLGIDRNVDLVSAGQDIFTSALSTSALLSPVLASNTTTASQPFATLTSSIAQQLHAVAKVIEARGSLGASRQIFMVSLGGFDTHTTQLARQSALFAQLGPALKAFNDAMVAIGESTNVTSFTLSDFARTLKPNTGGGSDHAWGNHHVILGGAVKGQRVYGSMPSLVLGGPDDAGSEGRWIPTTSVDQYAATLAAWFGVSPSGLAAVLPNLAQFPTANLGFV